MDDKNLLDIEDASRFLGVSIDTLRRWDKAGKLVAIRAGGKGSHRFYQKIDLELFLKSPLALAKSWVFSQASFEPENDFYCPNSSVFQARLSKMEFLLQKIPEFENSFSLITSVTGEIGNNSFDHNIGSWPDINGVFFSYDTAKRTIVLADRGHGILETLKRVRTELKNDRDALELAFTKIVTGRAPEKRGNGLKFVRKAVALSTIGLIFQSGDTQLELEPHSKKIHLRKAEKKFRGCLAFIRF